MPLTRHRSQELNISGTFFTSTLAKTSQYEALQSSHVVLQKPMHTLRVTVWCSLWSGGIIGLYFCQNDEGVTSTVNGKTHIYCTMITDFFVAALHDIDGKGDYF
ncbi:hypothetical protein DOY81_006408 [Sarcophaga bullata]|nr:hypothetical protein DOY81_006408 [Sarcophaga bullata]